MTLYELWTLSPIYQKNVTLPPLKNRTGEKKSCLISFYVLICLLGWCLSRAHILMWSENREHLNACCTTISLMMEDATL